MSNEHLPFAHEPTELPNIKSSGPVMYFEQDPRFIVKEVSARWMRENVGQVQMGEADNDYLQRVAAEGQMIQREFTQTSKIRTAPSQLVVSENQKNEPVLYRVARRVEGYNLAQAMQAGIVPEKEVVGLVTSLFNYYKAKRESGEKFFADTSSLSQYKYGKLEPLNEAKKEVESNSNIDATDPLSDNIEDPTETKEEPDTNAIYLTDTDPSYGDNGEANALDESADDEEVISLHIDDMFVGLLNMTGEITDAREYVSIQIITQEIKQYMEAHEIEDYFAL